MEIWTQQRKNEYIDQIVGEILRLQGEQDCSMADLAMGAGLKYPTLRNIVQEKHLPSLWVIRALCEAYHVPPQRFIWPERYPEEKEDPELDDFVRMPFADVDDLADAGEVMGWME